MSFSNQINKELSELKLTSKLEVLIELSSILKTNASISIRNAFINIFFSTESEYVVNRISNLLEYLYDYKPNISFIKNNNILKDGIYNLIIEDEKIVNRIMADSGFDFLGNYTIEISKLYERIISIKLKGVSAYLRGIYLGSGSMVNPQKSYHLEFTFNSIEDVTLLKKVLNYCEMDLLYKERKDKYIAYIKNSETISDYLNLIKANKSLLELENVKVEKDLRNNINRRMNFDMANMNKTIETALEQIKHIEKLEKYNALPENLQELAILRKNNPTLSLKDLGEMANPRLSKSNIAYKMKKIKELSEKVDK